MKLLTELLALSEDWGSSDWKPVMAAMDRLIDEHFDGKRTKKNIEAAAEDVAPRWQDSIGHDDVEDTVAAIVRVYMARRKDTIVEGYDTSLRNRELFDDYQEWMNAVRKAGVDIFKKSGEVAGAKSKGGDCGEFDKSADKGWLIKTLKEAQQPQTEIAGKAKWKAAAEAAGAVRFKEKHPDILAYNKADKEIGWFDGTDSTGYLDAKSPVQEAQGSEYWTIHNMIGVPKKFKKIDGRWENKTEAEAWMKSRENPKAERAETKRITAASKALDREDARREKKPKIDLQAVYRIVMDAIGNIFPDGDPIDTISPKLKRQFGLEGYEVGEAITAAMKKHGTGVEKKGMYEYMADMWDELANDAMHDAKNGHEAREPFVHMKDGKPVKQSNPWK